MRYIVYYRKDKRFDFISQKTCKTPHQCLAFVSSLEDWQFVSIEQPIEVTIDEVQAAANNPIIIDLTGGW